DHTDQGRWNEPGEDRQDGRRAPPHARRTGGHAGSKMNAQKGRVRSPRKPNHRRLRHSKNRIGILVPTTLTLSCPPRTGVGIGGNTKRTGRYGSISESGTRALATVRPSVVTSSTPSEPSSSGRSRIGASITPARFGRSSRSEYTREPEGRRSSLGWSRYPRRSPRNR